MEPILSKASSVHFGNEGYTTLNKELNQNNHSKIVIIVDENTHIHCLPNFLSNIETDISKIEIIEIQPGEINKTIETCQQVWLSLSELNIDRKALIINLGGGVVTDLGGFVACTYKRGIDYINVPTSLLAMVDASVGGKTGVDLGLLKNQIGVISEGLMVLVDTSFLSTLPQNQMKSGLAEMLKHGLIADASYWNTLNDLSKLTLDDLDHLIYRSIEIKNTIVSEDPTEQGIRKALNFGHTLGHAIETYCLDQTNMITLLHGEAIAIGMILEGYLSYKINNLSESDLSEIKERLKDSYPIVNFSTEEIDNIISLMAHDKKNSHGIVKFALLDSIGSSKIDCTASNEQINEAFSFYEQ